MLAVIWLGSLALAFAFPPFAVIPILIGCLLMFVGQIWFLIIAFQDDVVQGLLCLFIGIYALYYALTNLDEVKIPFGMQILGLVMIVSSFCAGGMHGK